MPIPRILHANRIQANANKTTRILRDIEFQKDWHSIRASPPATYENKTPRSKTAQNNLHGRNSIWERLLAANKIKTSKRKIDHALPQDALTYLQPTNNPIIKTLQSPPILSATTRHVIALSIKGCLPKKRRPQQCSADKDGPTKRCSRTKGAKRERPRQANQQLMYE